jgi:hypothetical protein
MVIISFTNSKNIPKENAITKFGVSGIGRGGGLR